MIEIYACSIMYLINMNLVELWIRVLMHIDLIDPFERNQSKFGNPSTYIQVLKCTYVLK